MSSLFIKHIIRASKEYLFFACILSKRGIMARKFAKSFYNSKRWKDCQSAYKTLRMGVCERCGSPNGTEVHHKITLNEDNINDPNVALNFDNLELLCKTCHALHHNQKYGATREGLMFDEFGFLIRRPETKTRQGFDGI